MILSHRFKEEDKCRVWTGREYCQVCGSNQNCSLHHIIGCKEDNSDSILNSIMLCNKCHKEADGHNVSDISFQEKYINITLKVADSEFYDWVKRDFLFIENCQKKGMVLEL